MQASSLPISGEIRTCRARARLGQTVLGRWRLEKLLGVGAMAAVFEASQPHGAPAAIKIMHADLIDDVEVRERFLAEAYAANRVAHPGVVTVRDEGTTEDGAVFLVMDLLRGETLARRLRSSSAPFSVGEVLEVASQLLEVLEHAHDRGVVHRDLKPENVFLMLDGRVRLLDFGLARVATDTRGLTPKPAAVGTPEFMPPEQAAGGFAELDGRSDLWALGATMYLLLSGQPVRPGGSATALLLDAMTRPVPSLGDVAALPRSVVAVVDRALAFEADDRFPNARSMQLALEAAFEELAQPGSPASVPPASEAPVALSLRTPFPKGRKRSLTPAAGAPALSTLRPVAANTTPLPTARPGSEPSRSALPIFVTLGFAIGIGLVVLARALVTTVIEPAAALQPVAAPELPSRAPARAELPAGTAPSASAHPLAAPAASL